MDLRDLFFNNAGLKLLALALAILTWSAIQFGILEDTSRNQDIFFPSDTREFLVPIAKKISATEERTFRIEPQTAKIIATGKSSALRTLTADSFEVVADLTTVPHTTVENLTRTLVVHHPEENLHVKVEPEQVRVYEIVETTSPSSNSQPTDP